MCKKLIVLTLCAFAASLLLGTVAQAGDPALIAWWKLDEGECTTALDSSGYEQHGQLSASGAVWVDDLERGMVISFDGTNGYIDTDVIIPALTPNNSFSWVFWIKQPAAQAVNNDTIMGNRYGGTASPLQFCKFTPTRFEAYNDDGSYLNGINYDPFPSDVWVHNAVVKDGAELTYYRDGVVALTNTMVKTLDENPFFMGADAFSGAAEGWQGYLSDVRLYTRALSEAEVLAAMAGKGPISQTAADPVPATEAIDIPLDTVLTWTPGEYAATHDVYLGTVMDDVNNASRANPMGVLLSQSQTDASYDPDGLLELGQTYYWRVDEVNAAPDTTIFKGEVWTFTAEPLVYPIANITAVSEAADGLEKTVDGSGLNDNDQHSTDAGDMWLAIPAAGETVQLQYDFDRVYKLHEMLVWNYNVQFEPILGFGFKDVTVEYSVDGAEWTVLGDVVFAQAAARADYTANTTVDFGGAAVQYVRLTVNSGYGTRGQFGLSEVRFLYIPAHAREPQPADGATNVDVSSVLDWRLGRDAISHDVYLSTDGDAVADGTAPVDTVSEAPYVPATLDFGNTYYWRVDEVQELESWAGDLWSFSTREYAVIDDMESYTDDEGSRIYEAWIDGYEIPENGAQVGYLGAPFAEGTTVNSGRQSMPLLYDNTGAATVSEATMDLGGMDLDTNGADSLRLFVYGMAPAFQENADGSIIMNGIGTDIWGTADEFRFAYKQLTGDGSVVARVDDLDESPNSWAKVGVMIRQDTQAGAVNAFMAMTSGDGGGATFQQRLEANIDSVSQSTFDGGPFAPPYWVRLDRAGDAISAFISPDGATWTQAAETVTIAMDDPVLVGLAVTSHNANQATSALFSNVSLTGASGAWQVAEIGATQPAGNDPLPIYVALGNAVVTHPADPPITGWSGWTEWVIPLSEFGNVSNVQSITIGIGGAGSGGGTVFIDDVGYGHPAPAVE